MEYISWLVDQYAQPTDMICAVLFFAMGLLLLIKGGDWFVDGATGLARRLHLPDIVVGATVVSIGTTLPEIMVSATGAMAGQGAMAYGNAIGSIICNTALIAAITVVFKPGPVNAKNMRIPVLFFFLAASVYCVASYLLGTFSRVIGIVLLLIFGAYMVFTVRQGIKRPELTQTEPEGETKPKALWLIIILLVVGAALIAIGADLLVNHGTFIAQGLGVPETVIALTFVSLGTSLPELVTTITSLRRGRAALGIGNVIGANIFNLVLVSGVSVTIAPFDVPEGKQFLGYNASLALEIPLMLCLMGLLTVPALLRKKLSRWQGLVLLSAYVAFCVIQFLG